MKKRKRINTVNFIIFLMAAVIVVPVVIMGVWVFTERWTWPDLIPQVFSFRAIAEVFRRKEQLLKVFLSSIIISTTVAILSAGIAIMTARALVFYEFAGKKIMMFLTVLPFMVPSTVFAMGVQITFIKLGLNNTVPGVIIAHLICSLPYAVRLLQDGTQALGRKLEEQAVVLGASPWKAFVKITLPILTPIMLSAVSMSYIVSFSQYFITLLIGGGSVQTFTIIMVPYLQSGDRNIACIYSSIFLIVTLAVFSIFELFANKWLKDAAEEFYQ